MRAIFKNTESDYLKATLEVDCVEIIAMDEFGRSDFKAGEAVDIELVVGLAFEE